MSWTSFDMVCHLQSKHLRLEFQSRRLTSGLEKLERANGGNVSTSLFHMIQTMGKVKATRIKSVLHKVLERCCFIYTKMTYST